MTKKILVTGASGFVGKLLTPQLRATGSEVIVAGRNVGKLRETFPDCVAISYDDLGGCLQDVDMVVHLAAVNNDQGASEEEFFSINRDLLVSVAEAVRTAAVKRFVNICSVHALDIGNDGLYARSKRAGAKALAELNWEAAQTVYLPLVHGERWPGKLARLDAWPSPLAKAAFRFLAALKPTLHVEKLAHFLLTEELTEPVIILSDDQSRNGFYIAAKRGIDLAFGLFVIIFLGWILLVIWLLVKLTSPGPGIFMQERIGLHGDTFTCYKFRTMHHGTRQAGTHEISSVQITPIGRFLRASKLDELPQVANILKNEISLIGPRPCLPSQEELIRRRSAAKILSLKPGISGYAQIRGIDMSDPKRLVASEAEYLKLRSLVLDFKIALLTATGKGYGDRTAN